MNRDKVVMSVANLLSLSYPHSYTPTSAGRPREQMIDLHDAARTALDRSGGLRRYVAVEAYRACARAVRRFEGIS